ncbi:hypothetical protein ACVFI8_03450 [Agarivorans sp. MS3-6]|nr:hypothetical protein [Agarivorans sp. TSD2052]UPW19905.1 hypothetical protein M0C34_06490 [Agarivorans sp. TSD2052]
MCRNRRGGAGNALLVSIEINIAVWQAEIKKPTLKLAFIFSLALIR